tara:strand:- start:46526 stop:47542 length:1017 start_codon:yes stop_codon:yes gene_type:complete
MRELKFLQACPDDTYYTWQVNLWLESLQAIGHSDKAISLIYTPKGRGRNPKWVNIMELYPEAEFHFYEDEGNLNSYLQLYIPILRPYSLWRYFKENPDNKGKAFFYCDSDILFTEDFNVNKFLNDDICYLSDTNSYINASYFDSKINQVLPEKLEEYKTRDILGEITSIIGISREICELNNLNSGGAQYLLKNIDEAFWKKVMNDCILIRTYLQKVNKDFFKEENAGFQSWCADMWAVLWNLWLRDQETKVIPEMAFAWATDPIIKLETHTIMHNAGIVSETGNGYPAFYKGKYHQGSDPTKDPQLEVILQDKQSQKFCTWYYTNKLKELSLKYNINY